MPELLQEVTGRLVSVEEGLSALDNHKTLLYNNSQMVKNQITKAAEKAVAALRVREKQLLRQVEVASTHQNTELTVTQAQLLQHKGVLSATRSLLDNCKGLAGSGACEVERPACCQYRGAGAGRLGGADGATIASTIVSTTINCLPHQDVAGLLEHAEKLLRVPMVSFTLDESSLTSTVQRFGRVTVPPSLSHNDLLPLCHEDYGDDEHLVLHKSVASGAASPAPIDVQRPYLVAARARQQGLGCGYSKACTRGTTPVSGLPKSLHGSKEDLMRWLHRLNIDEENMSDDLQLSSSSNMCELNIEEACQANEKCGDFSDCVLAGHCKKVAQEKAAQTARYQLLLQQWLLRSPSAQQTNSRDSTPMSSPRKRLFSTDYCSAAGRAVVGHMMKILQSNNSLWLVRNQCEVKNLISSLERQQLEAFYTDLANDTSSCKRFKMDDEEENFRTKILYVPPECSWLLMDRDKHQMRSDDSMLEEIVNVETKDDGIDAWLLAKNHSNVLQTITKKENDDMENKLCRANFIKSYENLNIENLKEKMDTSLDSGEKAIASPLFISDVYDKERWLLQQSHEALTDNKVVHELLKMKPSSFSTTSSTSFSIVSDPDSWLVH